MNDAFEDAQHSLILIIPGISAQYKVRAIPIPVVAVEPLYHWGMKFRPLYRSGLISGI